MIYIGSTWIINDSNGIMFRYKLEKASKTTAIFSKLTSHNSFIGRIKATHKLEEDKFGNFKRRFKLETGINFVYVYKSNSNNNPNPIRKCEPLPPCFNNYVSELDCFICTENKCNILTNCGHSYCSHCFDKITECAYCKLSKR